MTTPAIVYGGASITRESGYATADDVGALLDVLEENGVRAIDTSMLYAESEAYLGEAGASSRFAIDTKVAGMAGPQVCTRDAVVAQGRESLRKLGTSQVRLLDDHAQRPFGAGQAGGAGLPLPETRPRGG